MSACVGDSDVRYTPPPMEFQPLPEATFVAAEREPPPWKHRTAKGGPQTKEVTSPTSASHLSTGLSLTNLNAALNRNADQRKHEIKADRSASCFSKSTDETVGMTRTGNADGNEETNVSTIAQSMIRMTQDSIKMIATADCSKVFRLRTFL